MRITIDGLRVKDIAAYVVAMKKNMEMSEPEFEIQVAALEGSFIATARGVKQLSYVEEDVRLYMNYIGRLTFIADPSFHLEKPVALLPPNHAATRIQRYKFRLRPAAGSSAPPGGRSVFPKVFVVAERTMSLQHVDNNRVIPDLPALKPSYTKLYFEIPDSCTPDTPSIKAEIQKIYGYCTAPTPVTVATGIGFGADIAFAAAAAKYSI